MNYHELVYLAWKKMNIHLVSTCLYQTGHSDVYWKL